VSIRYCNCWVKTFKPESWWPRCPSDDQKSSLVYLPIQRLNRLTCRYLLQIHPRPNLAIVVPNSSGLSIADGRTVWWLLRQIVRQGAAARQKLFLSRAKNLKTIAKHAAVELQKNQQDSKRLKGRSSKGRP